MLPFSNAVPSLTVGGRVFTDLTNLIHLKGRVSSGNCTTTPVLAQNVVTGGYTPSGAKKFRALAVRLTVLTAVANTGTGFGYQDTDRGFQSNNSPVNGKQIGGLASNVQAQFSLHSVGVAEFPCNMLCPNGKFVYMGDSAGTTGEYTVDIFGYEEP